jgi:hypothetical protein
MVEPHMRCVLHANASEQFFGQSFIGKWFWCSPDLTAKNNLSISVWLSMVTGVDMVNIQLKGKEDYVYENGFPMHGLTCTNDPKTYMQDTIDGNVQRRNMYVRFSNEVNMVNTDLDNLIGSQMAGFIIKGMYEYNTFLNKLKQRNGIEPDFLMDKTWKESLSAITEAPMGSALTCFLMDTNCVTLGQVSDDPENPNTYKTPIRPLVAAFHEWCRRNSRAHGGFITDKASLHTFGEFGVHKEVNTAPPNAHNRVMWPPMVYEEHVSDFNMLRVEKGLPEINVEPKQYTGMIFNNIKLKQEYIFLALGALTPLHVG